MTTSNIQKSIQQLLLKIENYTNIHHENRINNDFHSDQIRSMDVPAMIEKDVPITVTFGPQSSGKTSVLNRLIRFPFLNTNAARETVCLYQIKIRANEKIDQHEVTVKVDGNLVKMKMKLDLESETGNEELRRILKEEQEKLIARNPGKSFHDNIISVEVQSSTFKDSYDLLDLPGLIALDANQSTQNDASKEIINLVKNTCNSRNVNYLFIHDARNQLDNNNALEFLRNVGALKSNINCVMTRYDGVFADKQDKNRVLEFVKNGIPMISPDKISLVVNRIPEDEQLFDDAGEEEWWKRQNMDELIIKKCGIRKLRDSIVTEATNKLVENSLPKLKKPLNVEILNLEQLLREKEKKCKEQGKNPMDIIKSISDELTFIYKGHDDNHPDKQLGGFKTSITKMYTTDLEEVMNKIKTELLDADFPSLSDDFCSEKSKAEQFMYDNRLAVTAIRDDAENLEALFGQVCKEWVQRIELFSARNEINKNYINKMKTCLTYICDKNTKHNPALKKIVSRVFEEESNNSEKNFYDFINQKVFEWYRMVTPFELLVGKKQKLKNFTDPVDGTLKTIETIDQAYEPFCNQSKEYLNKFVDKLWIDTQTAMRCDLITKLFEFLTSELYKKFCEEMDTNKQGISDFQSSDINQQLLEDLENCKKEKEALQELTKEIEKIEREHMQSKFSST